MKIISCGEARDRGLKRYFTGKECPNGHVSERLVSNGTCITCSKLRLKFWQESKLKEKRIGLQRGVERQIITRDEARSLGVDRYFTGNHCSKGHLSARRTSDAKCMVCVREKNRKRNKGNSEYIRFHVKKWKENNKTKVKAAASNRRKAFGFLTSWQISMCIEKQEYKCKYCFSDISDSYHVDHIVPISKRGWNLICNIQCLCPTCNMSKGAKSEQEFIRYLKNESV